ncbi:MAG: iron-containing alcohol dehydrogenase [Spirochaetales bacterium]|nr:iron-containing alcohol dehydrogenase [Spirochaetales bacterium]
MAQVSLSFPARVLYGVEIFRDLGKIAREIGTRTLVVTESVMHTETYLEQALKSLKMSGVDSIVFDDIPPSATSLAVSDAAELVRASKPHSVISLGGTRVLAVARLAALEGRRKNAPGVTNAVCIEVPTSCRNHSLFRDEGIITQADTSMTQIRPIPSDLVHTVLIDPTLTYSLSSRYFAVALLDTLLASVEGYMSDTATFFSDCCLERAIGLLGDALAAILRNPEDLQSRNKAAEAGMLSALGLGAASQGIGGALSLVINSKKKVPKSWVSSVLLPHVLELYIKDHPVKLAKISELLGEDVQGIHPEMVTHKAPVAARRILGALKLPARLRDLNLSLGDLGEVSSLSLRLPYSKTLPFRLNEESVYDLVKKAF